MSVAQTSAKTIFLQALELATASERESYLDTQCGDDSELRRAVDDLLHHSGSMGSFLESPPTAVVDSGEELRSSAPATPSLGFLTPSSRADSLGRLGHYEILEVVGSGGMGIVLKAFDEQLRRIVAIKALGPSLTASAAGRQRFVREAQAAAAVNHDNVVDIYAVHELGPVPYLVMEYIGGTSLDHKLKQRSPLELKEILRIGLQTADGLAAAHRQGLVHRDVKPANILLENGVGRVKITDFGLARAADDVSVTQTGVIAGTPEYMSPEQARGDAIDHRSDLFSLGSVLYTLCAGRTPFRGSNSLGVLKRVCEESPHPIRDLNPDIPQWLCAIVEKLHAKLPEERFQSATELAETLGGYLAHVQQPSLPMPTAMLRALTPPKPAFAGRGSGPRSDRRRWAIAAVVAIVLLGVTLSLTDASGITNVAATVIRIFTPEGTLVVETNDPGVKVTIESDGGLVITGAGLEEIRLRPGSYKVQASKDGKRVPLDQELVAITRGDKQVVRVRLEADKRTAKSSDQARKLLKLDLDEAEATLLAATQRLKKAQKSREQKLISEEELEAERLKVGQAEIAAKRALIRWEGATEASTTPENQAFVVLGGKGVAERKFPTLAEAVLGASDGDTIEIRDNGPFVTEPISITRTALTIRAGAGFRPVIKLSPESLKGNVSLISTSASLVLEGLELHRAPSEEPRRGGWTVVQPGQAPLRAANCRFRAHIWASSSPLCEFRNCEFLAEEAWIGGAYSPGARLIIENCLHRTQGCAIGPYYDDAALQDVMIQIKRSTFVSPFTSLLFVCQTPVPAVADRQGSQPIHVEVSQSIFDARTAMGFEHSGQPKVVELQPPDAEAALLRLLKWRGERNLFAAGSTAVLWIVDEKPQPPRGPKSLEEWRAFWGAEETGSLEGSPRFQGGNLRARTVAALDELTPEDFRLRPDSPGYRAGKDGKHLGADVDLVGPGPAYERWKKTAEYQEWLEETGQERFVQLFNGKDLTGWKSHPDQIGEWTVKDGILHGSPAQSYLFTDRDDFDDFRLRVEAKINAGGDSSICFRAPLKLQKWGTKLENYGISGGYEVDLHKNPSRLLRTGSIFVAHPRVEDPSQILFHVTDGSLVKADEWFVMEIVAEGNHLIIKLNGKAVADCQDPLGRHSTGHIALHVFNAATAVQFRKIEIKKLEPKAVAADDAARRELAKWQGEWENPDYGRLVIEGERWSSHPKAGFEVVSMIKIVEVTDEMAHILLLSAGVDGKVRTIQTILRVEGDTLHNVGTIGSVRPAEFASKPGFIYTQWKRVTRPPP